MSRKRIYGESLEFIEFAESMELMELVECSRRRIVAVIRRFEDILTWQKARGLTKSVYDETNQGAFARDYPL
jgi:hypothetical protein